MLRKMATLIPREFVKDAAGADNVKWRTFDPWSHLLTLVIVQPSRRKSLNGICDVAKALAYEWDRAELELRRRKAAAKLHVTMELSCRLPLFAMVEGAAHHDSTRAAACTACRYSAKEEERWFPDPLLPAAPFKVRRGSSQGVWLTVTAGRDAKAGIYKGEIRITGDMARGGKDAILKTSDWYCPLSRDYDISLSENLRAGGKQVWWYVCCIPKHPYANFASYEYPPIDARVLGWQTHLYRVDGLLYWHVNNWNDNQRNLDPSDTFFPEWDTHSGRLHMPGDGILLYPTHDGIVPSIRLALVRDGIEDYERLQMVSRLHGLTAADAISKSFIKSKFDFSRDSQTLLSARSQLGDLIERNRAEAVETK